MLPPAARLRDARDFGRAVRGGVRAGRPTLVVHAVHSPNRSGARVGFVVSRAVGGAVVRNRVKRRLRHLAARRLAATPRGVDLVVRALPPAVTAGAGLPSDLDGAWTQVLASLDRRAGRQRDAAADS